MPEFAPQAIKESVEQLRDQMVQWACDLIRFPSTQGNEAEAQAYLFAELKKLGYDPQYREIPESLRKDEEYSHADVEPSYEGRHNIVVQQRGTGSGRSLILQTHNDVVPAESWKEAFTPVVKEGLIIGRGATDCKGQVATLLTTMAVLKELGIQVRGDLEFQFVIEEEVGGNGALALIRQGCYADGVIVMEGTGLDIHPGNRGAIWFRCKTFGTPMHMGRRHEAVNAIEQMMEVIKWLLVYEEELIAASHGQELFDRYEHPVQLCLGMIEGGEWPSMVCGECTLQGGVGFLPNKRMSEIRQELREAVMRTNNEWLKQEGHFVLEFPKLHNDAYAIPADHPLPTTMLQACRRVDLASEVYGWNVSCDARLYNRVGGMPTVVFGPGLIKDAHADGEKIEIAQMVQAAQGLVQTIIEWCGS